MAFKSTPESTYRKLVRKHPTRVVAGAISDVVGRACGGSVKADMQWVDVSRHYDGRLESFLPDFRAALQTRMNKLLVGREAKALTRRLQHASAKKPLAVIVTDALVGIIAEAGALTAAFRNERIEIIRLARTALIAFEKIAP